MSYGKTLCLGNERNAETGGVWFRDVWAIIFRVPESLKNSIKFPQHSGIFWDILDHSGIFWRVSVCFGLTWSHVVYHKCQQTPRIYTFEKVGVTAQHRPQSSTSCCAPTATWTIFLNNRRRAGGLKCLGWRHWKHWVPCALDCLMMFDVVCLFKGGWDGFLQTFFDFIEWERRGNMGKLFRMYEWHWVTIYLFDIFWFYRVAT